MNSMIRVANMANPMEIIHQIKLAVSRYEFRSKLDSFYMDVREHICHETNMVQLMHERVEQAQKRKHSGLELAYRTIYERLANGAKLYEALAGFIPPAHGAIIEASMTVGRPADGLEQALKAHRAGKKMTEAAIGNLLTPIAYLAALLFIAFPLLGGNVVTTLSTSIPLEKMGSMFQFMHYTVNAAKAHPILFVAIVGGSLGWLFWSINHLTGPVRKVLDKVFPWSIVRQFKGAAFLVTLSGLFRNSVTLPNALEQIASWAPPYDKSHLDEMAKRASEGMASTEALDTGMLPTDAIDRLEVYERVGKFDTIMKEVGNAYIDRTVSDVDKATVRVAGFLRIVFFIVISMILSDYFGLYDVMQAQVNY